MDRYFYSLERDDNGKQIIHLSGNVYFNDGDETETCYRCAEWVWMRIDVKRAKEMFEGDEFFEYVLEKIDYISDETETSANEICQRYFNGTSGTELHITDITENTPCGNYWFEQEKGN